MELILTFLLMLIAAFVAIFYVVLAIFGMLLPIIFWVVVIWLVIRLIKKYT